MENNEAPARDSIDINSIVAMPTNVVYANTEQEVLVITKDKLHLCLQQSFRRTAERDHWLIPLGVLVPLVLTVLTSGFTKRFGIGGGEWETVFVMLIIFTAAWLAHAWIQRGKSMTVDAIVEELTKNPVIIDKTNNSAALPSQTGTLQAEPRQNPRPPHLLIGSDNQSNSDEDAEADPDTAVVMDLHPRTSNSRTRPVPELSAGDIVTHDKFGLGTVVSTDGYGRQAEAKIDFGADWGVKHLVLRYAPLEKL